MPDDIRDDPGWHRWEEEVLTDLVPKVEGSAYVMSLVPTGKVDVKFAVELGVSIMLDKPIFALVTPGAVVPERLRRVVDHICEADIEKPEGRAKAQQEMFAFVQRHGLAGGD